MVNNKVQTINSKFTVKTLLTLLFILPFFVFSQKSVIKKTYNLNGLEIAQFDFLDPMTYDEAVRACSKLGEGWRLPTKKEMEGIYENKDMLGGFVSPIWVADNFEFYPSGNVYYWSSSAYDSNYVWVIGLTHRFVAVTLKTEYLYARAVKSIK
jgi:hypothetical protein